MVIAGSEARQAMVQQQLSARGVRDGEVLRAMGEVSRAEFVSSDLVEFAYEDTPLPIDEAQTISQPYIVALMLEALELRPTDRLLDVGTGSGYAAAVASRIVSAVYGIERHATLVRSATERFRRLGYANVQLRQDDGTLGWPEAAPFDAIMVGAGGPEVPAALERQLAVGGRLVIPVGGARLQRLLRVRRVSHDRWDEDDLGPVSFVPLIGNEGWRDEEQPPRTPHLPQLVAEAAEPFDDVDGFAVDALLHRIGDARVVCLGESSHGTAEFYQARARITRALIEQKGFTVVALEADWPEAQRLDSHVRGTDVEPHPDQAFDRFPTWMWANRQVMAFVDWLRDHNQSLRDPTRRAGVYGLDLYSLHRSIAAVLRYLDDVDPEAARLARRRYACMDPWEDDPAAYGAAVLSGRYRACESRVVEMLVDITRRRLEARKHDEDPERLFDAERNAQLVSNAERYYRLMYGGSVAAWNLRDDHMFMTLESVLSFRAPDARAVVWAHNSHLGDASFTEMGSRGEHNVGELARDAYGDGAYLIGFGTHHGSVAAASDWDGPMEIKLVRPSHERSYERVFHDSAVPSFLLPLRTAAGELRRQLSAERLERAIGVIYRPETELQSHYFDANIARQFDEWVWLDETHAVDALDVTARAGMPQTYPFAV